MKTYSFFCLNHIEFEQPHSWKRKLSHSQKHAFDQVYYPIMDPANNVADF